MSVDRPYERHVFVCTTGPWCQRDGSRDVRAAMKRAVKEAGLRDFCRVNESGCLNQCGRGPMAVVYPDAVWYHALDVEKALRVVSEHVVGGDVVEDLRYRAPQVGNNKLAAMREADRRRKAHDQGGAPREDM